MFNTKVSLDDKLNLVYKFYQEVWGTDLIKDDRSEPPNPEQIRKCIDNATFPALEMLTLENYWHKARLWFYMKGDDSMLCMDGDPKLENYLEDLDEEDLFPKEIKTSYISILESNQDGIVRLKGIDHDLPGCDSQAFSIFDLTKPITINTIAFETRDGTVSPEKISRIYQFH